MRQTIAIAVAMMLMGALTTARAEPPKQTAGKLEVKIPVSMDFLLYLPDDYDKKESWPLVVFLHGAGERGSDLNMVKKHGPPKLVEAGKKFPFILVSPQCAKDRWWHWQLTELVALIDDISSKYKVDKDRIYLTGISMGGFGTWALAAYQPQKFAAIIPICGGGEPISATRLTSLPIWAFHGAKDFVVPLRRSEEMINACKRTNPNAKLTIYPDAGHDSWTETYDNPEVYEWLLRNKRNAK